MIMIIIIMMIMIIIIMMIMIIIILIMITLIPHLHTMNYHDVIIWAYFLVIPSDPGSRPQGLRAAGLGAPRGASAQAQRSRNALGPAPQENHGKPMENPWVDIVKSMEHLWKT
jgi:hypothetical protein